MSDDDDKFDKEYDLHPSQWSHKKKRAPFWGENAKPFMWEIIIFVVVGIPIIWLVGIFL